MSHPNEKLADQIEKLLNLAAALQLPIPADMHVQQLRAELPGITHELRRVHLVLEGDDPWDGVEGPIPDEEG